MNYRSEVLLTAAVAASVLLAVKPAAAASRPAQERAARKACLTGDYTKGVSILSDLFLDTRDPTYIFNQGRCFEQSRRFEEAIARFEEYLRTADSALRREDRDAAEKHITDCKESLAQERGGSAATPATPPALTPPPAPPTHVLTPEPTPAPESPTSIVVEPQPQPPASHGRPGLRIAGIVTASVGVAALVAAIILNMQANSIVNGMETKVGGYSSAKAHDRKTYETAAWVSYGVGGALVAAGAIMFGVGLRSGGKPSTNVALLPAVGPGQAGALLTGGF